VGARRREGDRGEAAGEGEREGEAGGTARAEPSADTLKTVRDSALLAPAYRPRRPTQTVLYEVVRAHLATFLAHARETYDAPLPEYVRRELRGYLRCGVFAHGFVRAHCDECGHDLLVVPAVPVRQWVLSLPYELRGLAAFDAKSLAAFVRIFTESIAVRYRACAHRDALAEAQTGAVTFVQRFGSSLNLHVPSNNTFSPTTASRRSRR